MTEIEEKMSRLAANSVLLTDWERNFLWECSHRLQTGGELKTSQINKIIEIEQERLQ